MFVWGFYGGVFMFYREYIVARGIPACKPTLSDLGCGYNDPAFVFIPAPYFGTVIVSA